MPIVCWDDHCLAAEVQALDRGLREVMLGTGRVPSARRRCASESPMLGQLIARAKEQGRLRPDIVVLDFPALQLMLGAVTEHIGDPELWRRYLALLIDGMRARPDLTPLPKRDGPAEFEQAIVASSTRDARRRAAEG